MFRAHASTERTERDGRVNWETQLNRFVGGPAIIVKCRYNIRYCAHPFMHNIYCFDRHFALQQFSDLIANKPCILPNGHAIDVDWLQISFKLRLMCYFLFVQCLCVCLRAFGSNSNEKKTSPNKIAYCVFHLDYFENFPTTVLCLVEQIECSKHTCSIAHMYSFNYCTIFRE